jgi:hypothetical protein
MLPISGVSAKGCGNPSVEGEVTGLAGLTMSGINHSLEECEVIGHWPTASHLAVNVILFVGI